VSLSQVYEEHGYQRIAAELAEKIDTGKLRHNDQIPTRPQLEEQYGVSRQVVRDALQILHQDGYLHSRPGRYGGTFVWRPPKLELPMYVLEADGRALDAFVAAVKDQGHDARQVIRVETAEATEEVAAALAIQPGDLVVVRLRLRFVDDLPYAVADSYFPQAIAAGTALADPKDIARGGRHVLNELGYEMVTHRDCIGARRPHRGERNALDIAPGLSLLTHDRISSTKDGQPVRFMRSVYPSDRWQLTYEVAS